MRTPIAALLILAVGGVMPAYVLAEVQDQSNPPISDQIGYFQVYSNFATGQVVQSGLTGQLSRIELGVTDDGAASPLFVDIAKTVLTPNARRPDFSVSGRLATRTVDASLVPNSAAASLNLSIDLTSANLHFSANDFFAIILRTNSRQPGFGWFVSTDNVVANTYPAGDSANYFYAENQLAALGYDQAFRTFVVVPEPSAPNLAGMLGLILLMGSIARHSSSAVASAF